MRKFVLTAALVSCGFIGLAGAASLQEAQTLLDKGDWRAASNMADDLAGADALALAAKANTLGADTVPEGQRQALYEKAVALARKAIAATPNNADAHFELARAEGRLAQFKGILESLGLAREVKDALDRTIDADKNYAGAYVALGLWNAELASKGLIATAATGASVKNVQPNFEKAISLEPTVVTHRLEYANALLKIGGRRNTYKGQAIEVLQKAVTLSPRTFWEERDLDAAKKLLASLR